MSFSALQRMKEKPRAWLDAFLVDAQLPPALSRWLTTQGHVAEHVADLDLAAAADVVIWTVAVGTGSTIVTNDRDFADRRMMASNGPPIVWLRIANMRRRELLAWFEQEFSTILSHLDNGELIVEVV